MTTPAEPSYRKHVGYQGGLLGGFATMAAAFLVMGNIATKDTIELRNAEDLQRSLSHVIPDALHDNNLLEDILTIEHEGEEVTVYRGTQLLKPTSVAFSVSAKGYSGEITILMGINHNSEILGVRILSHTETPGLGDKIEVEKDDWVFSFNGLSFNKVPQEKWKVIKDGGVFDQFSGATITPRAVVNAVSHGLLLFQSHKEILLAEKPAISNSTQASNATAQTEFPSAEIDIIKQGN